MEKNAQITAVKFKNINDEEQLYLKIETDIGKTVINIGEKTFNKLLTLTNKPAENDKPKKSLDEIGENVKVNIPKPLR